MQHDSVCVSCISVIACNILDHLVAGDSIMADKGFLIDNILPDGNNVEDDMSLIHFNGNRTRRRRTQ